MLQVRPSARLNDEHMSTAWMLVECLADIYRGRLVIHLAATNRYNLPIEPQDLVAHNCINLRLPTHGSLYAWEFEKSNRELKVRVEGQLTCNGTAQLLKGALAGLGLAYVPEGMVEAHIAQGRLKRVLADWCPPYSGYHLFYPSRRQSSAAFNLVVEALRYRPERGRVR